MVLIWYFFSLTLKNYKWDGSGILQQHISPHRGYHLPVSGNDEWRGIGQRICIHTRVSIITYCNVQYSLQLRFLCLNVFVVVLQVGGWQVHHSNAEWQYWWATKKVSRYLSHTHSGCLFAQSFNESQHFFRLSLQDLSHVQILRTETILESTETRRQWHWETTARSPDGTALLRIILR